MSGPLVPGLRPVVQLERTEQFRLDDLPADPAPDAGGVVKNQGPGYGADVIEHGAQPMTDALGCFAAVGLHEAHIRERERDDEDVQNLPDPAMMASACPKSTCAVPAGQTSSVNPSPACRCCAFHFLTKRCTGE
ncbi:hypothetical protein E3O21_09880 [Cryobacterium flavum]|uniref:Uncharacterized protein n=1 Tax=Cryobacterium flavum TaxID=1424659 RepID=A0ABY2I275_9MICO|nr:hypothetical protein E3O21_09880 [Cryobacterium flavum]